VYSKLGKGYVLLIFPVGGNLAHTNVVFGIEQNDVGAYVFDVMDPAGGAITTRTASSLAEKNQVIVGWPDTMVMLPNVR
jgi:hypothetical protein